MTKELLLARQRDLEGQLAEQREIQARGNAEIARWQRRVDRAWDQENAVGGAIQEVNRWVGLADQQETKTV